MPFTFFIVFVIVALLMSATGAKFILVYSFLAGGYLAIAAGLDLFGIGFWKNEK